MIRTNKNFGWDSNLKIYLRFAALLVSLIPVATLAERHDAAADSQSAPWASNLRVAFDFSSRRTQSLRDGDGAWQHAFGLDLHKVFQSEDGDYGTLVFQPYLVRLSNVKTPPFFFDDGDDWELTWRIANFNFTGLAHGKFNIRVGHFEIPFGLEQYIDTNGTLRQYTFADRGIKVDWGATINGSLEFLDYEFALTRGSGNDYTARHDPYLISGRIGTPASKNFIAGISWLYGDVLNAVSAAPRHRVGLDIAYYIYNWELLMEISGGENDGKSTANGFAEISWRTPMETLHLYVQARQAFNEVQSSWHDSTRLTVGANYDATPRMSFSTEIFDDLDALESKDRGAGILLQFRVRI